MGSYLIEYLSQKQGTILKAFLAFIVILFIGILVAVYVVSKRANPILLDERGNPINAESLHRRN